MRAVPVTSTFFVGLLAMSIGQPVAAQDVKSQPPEGAEKTTKAKVLELGASVLQGAAPLRDMDIYLDGFHVMKDNPQHQMEAHHYCRQVNEDFAQCVLFDGNTAASNLNGIEYIISGRLFESLPPE